MMWSRKTSTFNPWWNASPGSLTAKSFWQQATYLHHLLKEMDCRISRPAQGLPAGSGLSHADTLTLMKALEGRTRL